MFYIQENTSVRKKPQPRKGRIKSKKRQAKVSTPESAPNNFLRHSFSVAVCGKSKLQGWREKEQSYFSSLANLAAKFGFVPLDVSKLPYPQNIHLSYNHASRAIKKIDSASSLLIAKTEDNPAFLSVVKSLDLGYTLYYIPLRPLVRIGKSKRNKGKRDLLICICAYLYHIVHIPSYFDGDFVGYVYDYQKETWEEELRSGEDAENFNVAFSELNAGDYYGNKFRKIFNHPYHLKVWEDLLKNFKVKSDQDGQLLELSKKMFDLFRTFPNRKFYDNIIDRLLHPSEESIMRADSYVSFVWTEDGCLMDNLVEYVNIENENSGIIEEPLYVWNYSNSNPEPNDDLFFEETLFDLLGDLATLLNEL